jgi:nitroreductase
MNTLVTLKPQKLRPVPRAMKSPDVQVYLALPDGLYRYDAPTHRLHVVSVTGHQDFVDTAPLDLVFVADFARTKLVPAAQREAKATGAMAQNVYLFCARAGLATVIRAWLDREALAHAMGLKSPEAGLQVVQHVVEGDELRVVGLRNRHAKAFVQAD